MIIENPKKISRNQFLHKKLPVTTRNEDLQYNYLKSKLAIAFKKGNQAKNIFLF